MIEISPELQIAPQEDATLFMEGPVADAADAQVIADASAGSEQTGPEMTEEAPAASEEPGESETPTEVLSEAPAEALAEAPAAAD